LYPYPRWAAKAGDACEGEQGNKCRILVGKPGGKKPFTRPRRRLELRI
jgi:hypothetical protein